MTLQGLQPAAPTGPRSGLHNNIKGLPSLQFTRERSTTPGSAQSPWQRSRDVPKTLLISQIHLTWRLPSQKYHLGTSKALVGTNTGSLGRRLSPWQSPTLSPLSSKKVLGKHISIGSRPLALLVWLKWHFSATNVTPYLFPSLVQSIIVGIRWWFAGFFQIAFLKCFMLYGLD